MLENKIEKYLVESKLEDNYFILRPGDEAERKSIKFKYCNSCYTCRYGSKHFNKRDIICQNVSVLNSVLKYNKERDKRYDEDEYQVLTGAQYTCDHWEKTSWL
jgi:hypothetical protein